MAEPARSPDALRVDPRVVALLLVAALLGYAPWALDKTAAFDVLVPMALSLLVHGACVCGGTALSYVWLAGGDLRWSARLGLGWALGAGVLGTAMTLLAWLQLFNALTALLVVVALAVLPAALVRPPLPWRGAALDRGEAATLLGVVVVAAGAGLLCLAPPMFHDTLTYHLALPMHWAAAGGAEISALDPFSAYPMLGELTSSPALLLGSPVAMAVCHALFLLPLGLLAHAFGKRFVDDSGGMAAAVLLTSPVLLFCATNLKPDLLAALFTLAGLFGLAALIDGDNPDPDAPNNDRRQRLRRTVAVFAGLLMATRYTGLAWGGLLLIALVVAEARAGRRPGGRGLGAIAGLTTLAGALPYLGNLVRFGNPVFPMASGLFGGPAWMPHTAAILDGMARRVRDAETAQHLLLEAPLTFTFDNPGTMNDLVGTLPLIVLPLAFLLRRRPPAVVLLAGLLAASLPMWWLSQALVRLNPLLFVPLALLTGWVLARLASTTASLRALTGALVVVLCAGNVLWTVRADALLRRGPWAVISGASSSDTWLRREFELYPAFAFINEKTPADARVMLFTGDWRSAYLERPVDRSGRLTPPRLETIVRAATTVDEVLKDLRATGADVLVVATNVIKLEQGFGWLQLPPPKMQLLEATLASLGPPAFADAHAAVFLLGGQTTGVPAPAAPASTAP